MQLQYIRETIRTLGRVVIAFSTLANKNVENEYNLSILFVPLRQNQSAV
jgi:hypothetical protein